MKVYLAIKYKLNFTVLNCYWLIDWLILFFFTLYYHSHIIHAKISLLEKFSQLNWNRFFTSFFFFKVNSSIVVKIL